MKVFISYEYKEYKYKNTSNGCEVVDVNSIDRLNKTDLKLLIEEKAFTMFTEFKVLCLTVLPEEK